MNVQGHLFLIPMIMKIYVKNKIHIHTRYLIVNVQNSEMPT